MQPGELDQLITLQNVSVARDATYGEAVQTFADAVTVWAKVAFRNLTTPEMVIEGQVQSTMRVIVTIRYYASMNNRMRIKHGTRYYQVLDYSTLGRDEFTRITASEWNEGRR